jgi:hypothetical protein
MRLAVHGVELYLLAVVFVAVLIPTIVCGYRFARLAWRGGYEIASTNPLTGAGNPHRKVAKPAGSPSLQAVTGQTGAPS